MGLRDLFKRRKPVERELPWIHEINKVLGLHEVRDNARLKAWLISDGETLGDPSKLPWCGDATETAIYKTLFSEPRITNPYWARNWAGFGIACGRVFGAVAVFQRGSGGHVGFLVGVSADGKQLRILGGNQGDTVSEVWIKADRLLALRWPSTHPTQDQRPAPVLKSDGTVSTNES